MINIATPFTEEIIENLKAGDELLLSGEIYTGRDAAHKRMVELLDSGQPLPIKSENAAISEIQAIYYVGPCPAPPGRVIGSAGPTTSGRMDKYAPRLMAAASESKSSANLRVMLGKGERNQAVTEAIRRHKGLYLSAVGGAGAYLSQCIEKCELIAFEDLGTEAIHKLTVKNMPLTVAIDSGGNSIFER